MVYRISSRRPDLIFLYKKKKRICFVDFAVPSDHSVKIKENEKINEYLHLVKEEKSGGRRGRR